MTFESQAASMSQQDIIALLKAHRELQQSHDELRQQMEWFKRQLFGSKSERRVFDPEGRQLTLGEIFREPQEAKVPEVEVPAHRRRRAASIEAQAEEGELRFDPSVPVQEIVLESPELKGEDLSAYEQVGEKVTLRLAQRPGAYVVLRYVRKVYKRKSDGVFSCPPAPPSVVEKSCADVSFLVGLVVDKFSSHLPLYRQHQRLEMAGIHLSRPTLTNLVHRTAELLEPVYTAQLESILSSKVLAMDETPIKAGRKKRPPPLRGEMKTGYFWPIYGDKDEIAFPFANTRAAAVVRETLKSYGGVLLTDGYGPYEQYANAVNTIVHAQCWSHVRRHYEKAETAEPDLVKEALDIIAALYEADATMKSKVLPPEKVLAYRAEHLRPIVDHFFERTRERLNERLLLPSNLYRKAVEYAWSRKTALQVFLEYPDVPLDTNHLERAIRPVAIGRKNYLFCWTEVGAKYAGILHSLIGTCRIQGVNVYTYLVDVLQRIDAHPAKDVALLTPRLWKDHFAANPLRSDVYRP